MSAIPSPDKYPDKIDGPLAERSAFNYDGLIEPSTYHRTRELGSSVELAWKEVLQRQRPLGEGPVIDLGCGTGRFLRRLSEWLSAKLVIGVEPSEKMRIEACVRTREFPRIQILNGTAENIPVAGPASMIFMSNMYHHIQDKSKFFAEAQRLITSGGRIFIRNMTRDDLKNECLFKFFPTAKAVETGRVPGIEELVQEFRRTGFHLVDSGLVQQEGAQSLLEYASKVESRCVSALKLISDAEFAEGLRTMKEAARTAEGNAVVRENIRYFAFCLG